jgi:hypothetical protein
LCAHNHKSKTTRKKYSTIVKFKSLYEKAKHLDNLIDDYIKTKQTNFVPFGTLQEVVPTIFPGSVMFNFGLHKLVFYLRHKSHELALKIGKAEAIEVDHRAYKQLPTSLRHVYFATIFWHTRYCLLQEYGVEAEVSVGELEQVRIIARKYGLLDLTCDNVRKVNGKLKIIDASIAPSPVLFGLWKTADVIKLRLPPPIRKAIRKSRMLATAKQR